MTQSVCYLCGRRIVGQPHTDDHVVPRVLLQGQPPKVRGFDFGGHLPTHKKCNNEFGPEAYAQRAIELIDVLHRPECSKTFRHPDDQSIRLMALNSQCLPNFTKRDLRYFKILDRTADASSAARPDPQVLRDAEAVDPFKAALDTALAVLLKSAAAVAIKRKMKSVPQTWQVMAVPYVGDATSIEFDDLLGTTKPFSPGVKVWAGVLETNDILVVYRASRVLVYFFFRTSATMTGWRHMRSQFVDRPRLRFDGKAIKEVLISGWKRV